MQSYKLLSETFTGDYLIEYFNGKITKILIRSKIGNKLKFSLHGKKIEFKKIGDIYNV